MLSSIANYIFGGGRKQAVEEPIDYNTKEEDEWLLVDVSGHSETEVPVQKIEQDYEDDDDDDDVLTSVPFLMPLDGSSNTFVESMSISYPRCEESWLVTPSSCLISEIMEDKAINVLPIEKLVLERPVVSLYKAALFYAFPERCLLDYTVSFCVDTRRAVTNVKTYQRSKAPVVNSYKPKSQQSDKRANHPAELSRTFVNHRSPVLLPKTELLEQIKELKPSQQAKEYQMRKLLGRSQLNRQNRCYIYESTAKTRRRKDVWQRNSGVNNNRKCC